MLKAIEGLTYTTIGLGLLSLLDALLEQIGGLYGYVAMIAGLLSIGLVLLAGRWCLARFGLIDDADEGRRDASRRERNAISEQELLEFIRGKGGWH